MTSEHVNDHLAADVARATSLSPVHVHVAERPALDHQSNRLYDVAANSADADGRRFILKEYLKPDEWDDAPRREFGALQLLAPLDIAPRPVFCEPAAPPRGPLVAYEFMEGEMWDRRKPTPIQLAQLADVWLMMNRLPTQHLWRSRWIDSLLEAETRMRGRFLARALAWPKDEFAEQLEDFQHLELFPQCES